jgi:hypothetical protein
MKSLRYCIFLLISVSCLGGIKPNHADTETKCLFEQYLLAFGKQGLPFKMDRKAVFEMMNNADSFFEIKDSLKTYIPEKLIENQPGSKFRSLYMLPEHNEIVLVLIFEYYVDEYENEVVKNYMVSYGKSGVVLDYQELAGVKFDGWEAYLAISEDYTVKRKLNQFRVNNDNEKMQYMRLVETCFEYTISKDGLIEETKRTAREGYFQSDRSGYNFIEPLK